MNKQEKAIEFLRLAKEIMPRGKNLADDVFLAVRKTLNGTELPDDLAKFLGDTEKRREAFLKRRQQVIDKADKARRIAIEKKQQSEELSARLQKALIESEALKKEAQRQKKNAEEAQAEAETKLELRIKSEKAGVINQIIIWFVVFVGCIIVISAFNYAIYRDEQALELYRNHTTLIIGSLMGSITTYIGSKTKK